jgi:hypothetical protein
MRWAEHVVHMGARRVHTVFSWSNQTERNHLADLGTYGRIILKRILKWDGGGGMDWIELALNRNKWWAFVNVVMDLRLH